MSDGNKTSKTANKVSIPDLAAQTTRGALTVATPHAPSPPVSPAPKRGSWLIWAGLVVVVIAAGALWFLQPWVSKAVVVQVETVTPGALSRVLAVNGRIVPLHRVDVKATTPGAMLDVLVDEGQAVTLGDVLAHIDATAQQAVVRQSLAALDAGLVAQAQAGATFARTQTLGINVARTALADARAAAQTADQEVARLTAVFDQAQAGLANYTLRAPISGTILARTAEVGQSVDITAPLFTLADLAQLVVETDVDEAYATQVTVGQPAVLQLVGEGETRPGSVGFVAPQVDADTGGLAVKLVFDQAVAAPVGLTVTANITVDSQTAAISVPRAAVVTLGTGSAVFVVVGNVALRREVAVVPWPAARLMVTKGLNARDVVIVDATGVLDGQAVTVGTSEQAALSPKGAPMATLD